MKKIICLITALLLILAVICSCSSAPSEYSPSKHEAYEEGMTDAPEEYTDEQKIDSSESTSANPELSGLGNLGGNITANTNRKLVYSSSYSIQTEKYDEDYAKIIAAAKKVNGYVSYENSYGTAPEEYGDTGRTASLTVKVPVESYTAFTEELSGIGYITEKNQNTEDITSQYVDTESRISLLETQYAKLDEHLKKATKMSDIIELEEEMCNILNELDSLKGTKREYDYMVAYSTVEITLTEVTKASEIPVSKEGFWERVGDSLSETLSGMGSFFEGFLIVIITISPVLLVLGIIFAAIFIPINLSKKRKARKKAIEAETKAE